MTLLSIALILGGVAAVAWGLPAAHRLTRPWDSVAALLFLAGLSAALVGVLLAFVPRFFG
ncbi:hypothetical protein [Geobacter sp.]|uniref:hypothetical protein n=1 Tax=Geobacter sp. TaxID=46610 RepID=UPI00261CE738|nr:hypothetical protein [Geobacter sp.]